MRHGEKAEMLFKEEYNCAQSVVGAYEDVLDIDFETLMKLSSSFGGGMGRLREVCGACTGMFIVAGLLKGYSDPKNKAIKTKHYELIQKLGLEFEKRHGSLLCRDLLGLTVKKEEPTPSDRTKKYYETRPCLGLVKDACDILDEYLEINQ